MNYEIFCKISEQDPIGQKIKKAVDRDLRIDLRDKLLVWYRAISSRPVEILGIVRLPRKRREIEKSWKRIMIDTDRRYDEMTDFCIDFIKGASGNMDYSYLVSFYPKTAVVERKTIRILSFNYGVPDGFLGSDANRNDQVEAAIKNLLLGNKFY
jgi:hypothetical protein